MFSRMCKFVFVNDIFNGVLLLTLKFLQILYLPRITLSTLLELKLIILLYCNIYIYIYIHIHDFFQINHESRFTPVKDDHKQTIQVSSFA